MSFLSRLCCVGLLYSLVSCAAGDEPNPTGGSAGANSGGGGSGGIAAGGQGGVGGSGGSATGGSGGSGGGAAGGGGSGALDLCVLNEGGPYDACQSPSELDFGVVSSGQLETRTFRIDNGTSDEVLFKQTLIDDSQFEVTVVRFEEDPGDPGNYLRVEANLPLARQPGDSLWFEVKYTALGATGPLPAEDVTVKHELGGSPVADTVVPIVGSESGCPEGLGACDGEAGNGCETNTNTSNEHCGQCGMPCDPGGGTGQCVQGVCTLSGCDPFMADCDLMAGTGCETNLLNDVMSCGKCGNSCEKANTVAFCNGGNCNVSGCLNNYGDCNLMPVDGCETNLGLSMLHCGGCNLPCALPNASEMCTPNLITGLGVCLLGSCDAGFENCDLTAANGCEVNTDTDVNNCGNCFSPCAFDNAAESCSGGSCVMGMCDQNFGNCNGFTADGCESNLLTDKDHCGTCAVDCDNVFANSVTSCQAGGCQTAGCLPGYYDIDGNAANGCEYACSFISATDNPDDAFTDSNCDGIDGNLSDAIFVSTGGNDANPGTKALPVATVLTGIARAQSGGQSRVLVSSGVYVGRVSLVPAISIHGGYSATNNWQRSSLYIAEIRSSAVSGGRVTALDGNNIIASTTVDRMTIRTFDTSVAGVSNYAVYCNNCDGLTLKNNTITAGDGGNGIPGLGGNAGTSGGNGGNGSNGSCDTNGPGGPGGGGGTSGCSRTGGGGGQGGSDDNDNGSPGGPGVGGTLGGSGGAYGSTGQPGNDGTSGNSGNTGSSGSGGTGGSLVSNLWTSNSGGTAGNGTNGNGGGGGGGGGGQSCFACDDGQGNGGGGGGAGGCFGTGGAGGGGGGGSFGVFLIASGASVTITNNLITSGNGGAGGNGGDGGTGGAGGNGGNGAVTCTGEVGRGGDGGDGGNGGNGGLGGGGAGGPSYGIYRSTTTGVISGNTVNAGSGGSGGLGGNNGSAGASANQL